MGAKLNGLTVICDELVFVWGDTSMFTAMLHEWLKKSPHSSAVVMCLHQWPILGRIKKSPHSSAVVMCSHQWPVLGRIKKSPLSSADVMCLQQWPVHIAFWLMNKLTDFFFSRSDFKTEDIKRLKLWNGRYHYVDCEEMNCMFLMDWKKNTTVYVNWWERTRGHCELDSGP